MYNKNNNYYELQPKLVSTENKIYVMKQQIIILQNQYFKVIGLLIGGREIIPKFFNIFGR